MSPPTHHGELERFAEAATSSILHATFASIHSWLIVRGMVRKRMKKQFGCIGFHGV
jgi:hypothetical protein